jgi:uncharacterized protein
MRVTQARASRQQPASLPNPWRRSLTLAVALASLGGAASSLAQTPQALPTITLRAGMHNIVAQVAQNDEQRQTGLMHRKTMPTHEGMLFIFEAPAVQCFWMKNTLLPLDIAFVADDGTIVNIDSMAPQTLESHCSKHPVRYVLEMNEGWFKQRNIKAGFKLAGATFKPAVSQQR